MTIRENVWNCVDCDTRFILGRHKSCPSCGSPRDRGEVVDMSSGSGAAVTDAKLLDLAAAGPDWFCTHCQASSRGDVSRCSKCGAPRYGEALEEHPTVPSGMVTSPSRPAPPAPPSRPAPPAPPAPPWQSQYDADDDHYPPKSTSDNTMWYALAATVATVLLAFLISWAYQTHDSVGKVSATSWHHEVVVERWVPHVVQEWEHDVQLRDPVPPKNGSGEVHGMILVNNSCRREIHHYDQIRCGSHKVCEDVYTSETKSYPCGETCRDLGNGFRSCSPKTCTKTNRVKTGRTCKDVVDYCDDPVYRDKCDYTTHKWATINTLITSGTASESPTWNVPTLQDHDRYRKNSEYKITISYEDGGRPEVHEVALDGARMSDSAASSKLKEYIRWAIPGQDVYLKVNNLGGVSEATLDRK